MTREQLEHILRAAGAITGASRFVIIGSQSILGQYPAAPNELLISWDADIYSLRSGHDTDLVEGSIGEGSPFHQTFGYFAHGVAEETATLPAGWKDRLIPVASPATNGTTGLCLEVNDLAVSKLVAGREKDATFLSALFRHGLAQEGTIRERLASTALSAAELERCLARLTRLTTPQKNSKNAGDRN